MPYIEQPRQAPDTIFHQIIKESRNHKPKRSYKYRILNCIDFMGCTKVIKFRILQITILPSLKSTYPSPPERINMFLVALDDFLPFPFSLLLDEDTPLNPFVGAPEMKEYYSVCWSLLGDKVKSSGEIEFKTHSR